MVTVIHAKSLQSARCSCMQANSEILRPRVTPSTVLTPRCRAQGLGRVRGPLMVRANELNRWGDTDGRDESAGLPENGFDRDTAAVVLRVLTARAVQGVLLQLQEVDMQAAHYLNNFAAENPPSREGNMFIFKLFSQPGRAVRDAGTGSTHTIDPQRLAHRILQVREDMARSVTAGFPGYVSLENTTLLRSHLETNSYICGSSEGGYKTRRGNFRARRGRRQ